MEKILTLKEVAQYIKLNERTILKMANNNEIPAKKIGNQWRFILSKVDEWLSREIKQVDTSDLNALIKSEPHIIPISRLFNEKLINLDLNGSTKDEILEELSMIPVNSGLIKKNTEFYARMKSRENLMSTALNNGFAIPHPRYPVEGLFSSPVILLGRSKKGVSFESLDNSKTHLFFVSCATNEAVHLRLLAKLGRLFKIPGIFDKLMQTKENIDIIKILVDLDSSLLDFSREALSNGNGI
ncbi:PTS sugar transporter subunit IIA [bacterium]|nr:PTS sugar transporter subunit IIA [bacterium]